MTISEKKMQIVIDHYFKSECDVNTSIRQAFEKGFRIGVKKGQFAEPEREKGEWILKKELVPLPWDSVPLDWDNYDENTHSVWKEYYHCSNCDWKSGEFKGGNFCRNCVADMRGEQDDTD